MIHITSNSKPRFQSTIYLQSSQHSEAPKSIYATQYLKVTSPRKLSSRKGLLQTTLSIENTSSIKHTIPKAQRDQHTQSQNHRNHKPTSLSSREISFKHPPQNNHHVLLFHLPPQGKPNTPFNLPSPVPGPNDDNKNNDCNNHQTLRNTSSTKPLSFPGAYQQNLVSQIRRLVRQTQRRTCCDAPRYQTGSYP